MARPKPRLRGWWRVFGHPTDGWASATLVQSAVEREFPTRSNHYPDACDDPGAHILMDPTAHVYGLPEALKSTRNAEAYAEAKGEHEEDGDSDVVQ